MTNKALLCADAKDDELSGLDMFGKLTVLLLLVLTFCCSQWHFCGIEFKKQVVDISAVCTTLFRHRRGISAIDRNPTHPLLGLVVDTSGGTTQSSSCVLDVETGHGNDSAADSTCINCTLRKEEERKANQAASHTQLRLRFPGSTSCPDLASSSREIPSVTARVPVLGKGV